MRNLLVVDDNKTNLQLVKQLLSKEYNVFPVLSGKMALHYMEKRTPDLILLDLLMPEMDGLTTMKKIRERENGKEVPIIFLTADQEKKTEITCLNAGAYDFIAKPFEPEVMRSRIQKAMEYASLRNLIQTKLAQSTKQVDEAAYQTVISISHLLEAKDNNRKDHYQKVAYYSGMLAKALSLSKEQFCTLECASYLYDIGYMGVPEEVFQKKEVLSEPEYRIMKNHTITGSNILNQFPILSNIQQIARSHHERYDGTGYPDGLAEEEIPLLARIINLTDSYVALLTNRSYRPKMTREQAIKELKRASGSQFDPMLVTTFIEQLERNQPWSKQVLIQKESYSDLVDATKLMQEANQLLKYLVNEQANMISSTSTLDSLTELHNRKYFEMKILEYLQDKNQEGCFFIIDIDNFKFINDTRGHLAGDAILKHIACMIRSNVREADLTCRMGGDEFAIFFKGLTSKPIIKEKARRILSEYARQVEKQDELKITSLSIGVSITSEETRTFERLYQNADQALYYVKHNGKNNIKIDQEKEEVKEPSNMNIVNARNIMNLLHETEYRKGAFKVSYSEFQQIYNFLSRCVDRMKQKMQLLLFTIQIPEGNVADIEQLEEVVMVLEEGIMRTLRKNDVSTRYSSCQYIVILVNTDEEGASTVVQRVRTYFRNNNKDKRFEFSYDIAEVIS